MKSTLSLLAVAVLICLTAVSCKKKNVEAQVAPESPCKAMVEEYAYFDLKSDLVAQLSDNEKQLMPIFVRIAEIMNDLFLTSLLKSFSLTILVALCIALSS